jgi:hypothetical protein
VGDKGVETAERQKIEKDGRRRNFEISWSNPCPS